MRKARLSPRLRSLVPTGATLVVVAAAVVACSPTAEAPSTSGAAEASPTSAPVENQSLHVPLPAAPPSSACGASAVATMSTRDKLAQLLMVGVTGADDARAVVTNHRVGGIFIGSWTDLSMLGAPLAEIAASSGPLALAVSTDEEGGSVSRLASVIGSAPSARALAQTGDPQQAYDSALTRGRAMRGLGITVDFAPVVDVDAGNSAIGDRSFGSDPAVVTEFAGAYARGLRDAGVLPVLKHFPGHGNASGDSHTGAVTTPPLAELENTDLVPYRTLVSQAPVAVMLGHLQVPGLTGSDPASLSPAAVGLLRGGGYGGPGFGGPVFTDDLSGMAAITSRYGIAEAALRALQAGADQALWLSTGDVPAVLDRLESAVASGELSSAAVDASVHRMAAVKGQGPQCGR